MSKTLIENHKARLKKGVKALKKKLKLRGDSAKFFDNLMIFIDDFYERNEATERKDWIFRAMIVIGSLAMLLIK